MNNPEKVRKYYSENRILSLTRAKPVVSYSGIFVLYLALCSCV